MPPSPRPASPYLNGKRKTQLVAMALTIAAVLVVLLVPQYSTATVDSAGHSHTEVVTALTANGPRFLLAVAVPLVLAGVPLAVRGRAWQTVTVVCTVLFCVFTALAFLTIGVYLFPAAVVQIVAASKGAWRRLT